MGLLEDNIEQMERRLEELEPMVREAESLKESIASLKAILARERGEEPEPGIKFEQMTAYMRLPVRKAQVAQILAEKPGSTNQEIADLLGLTAARVSQIRSAMREDEEKP